MEVPIMIMIPKKKTLNHKENKPEVSLKMFLVSPYKLITQLYLYQEKKSCQQVAGRVKHYLGE
jgi:hypothetical protein